MFEEAAEHVGFDKRMFYKVSVVSKVTGISADSIYDAINAGSLRAWKPPEYKQGKLIKAEWVDDWMKDAQ